jgi:hypothetical protein
MKLCYNCASAQGDRWMEPKILTMSKCDKCSAHGIVSEYTEAQLAELAKTK